MATNSVDYRAKVVASALSYVNVVGGKAPGDDQFIEYYNKICGTSFDVDTTPWCAIFATYNLRMAGVPTSVCPNFAGCTSLRDNFLIPKKIWKLRTTGYSPLTGDLIMFNWNKDMTKVQHVGIVEKVVGSVVYTIEGNSKGSYTNYGVRHKSYQLTSPYIVGYGALPYESISGNQTTVTSISAAEKTTTVQAESVIVKTAYKSYIKSFQKWLNANFNSSLTVDGSYGPATKKAGIKALQTVLNQSGAKLKVDGVWGTNTRAAVQKYGTLKYGSKGTLVYIAQGFIYCNGISAGGFDGSYGILMRTSVGTFQTKKGITKDHSIGPVTWAHLVA